LFRKKPTAATTAATTEVTPEVTTAVTTEVTTAVTTEVTAVVTPDATSAATTDVTTSATTDVAPNAAVSVADGEGKLAIYYDLDSDQAMLQPANLPTPQRQPSAKEQARELCKWLQRDPRLAGRFITSYDLEMRVHPYLCRDNGWSPKPWRGKRGVAKHLGLMIRARYQRIEDEDGEMSNVRVYEIPDREVEVVRLEQAKRKRA
jgi:hypothetical protein